MASSAQLSVIEPVIERRGLERHPVDHRFRGEHRRRGDLDLHVVNVSAHGFMTATDTGLSRGERVVIRLPHVGRIEAHVVWAQGARSGFQFERILRADDFALMIAAIPPDQRPRQDH